MIDNVDILLVDAKNMLWRVAEVHPELVTENEKGEPEPTGAVYGFLVTLVSVHERIGGLSVVCWDSWNAPLERRRLFPAYKAGRAAKNRDVDFESMDRQMYRVMRLLQLAGVRQAYSPGWEADDVMATLARSLGQGRRLTALYTADRDLYQTIDEHTVVVRPRPKGELIVETVESVRAEWGVEPDKWIDLRALLGDRTDGIPGCPQIGPKWAKEIFKVFDSVDQALDLMAFAGSSIPDRIRERLKEYQDQIRLSYRLSQLNREALLKFLRMQPDRKALARELLRLGFKSLLHGHRYERLFAMGGGAITESNTRPNHLRFVKTAGGGTDT